MRIEKIRLRNLNSLAGEWTIDFTHPAFAADGLFAITGPTGAGKSTILDAISLGLYGCTPRLGKLTKSDNEIISVGAGDCLAEVTFSTRKGRFRTCWSQRRARKKADGALQPPEHEFVDAATNKVLETKVKEVLQRVEDATGMDYDRFSRSVLLPQGRFADFLAADADARAPLLEQITGTEIYRDISVETHRRLRAEQDKLAALRDDVDALHLMTEEEETALAAQITEKTARRETAAAALAREERALDWLENLARLREQATETATKFEQKKKEDEAFQPERDRLALAEKALELAAAHSALALHRSELAREERALADCEARLPALREQAEAAAAAAGAAEKSLAQTRAERDAQAPLFTRVRELDTILAEKAAPLRAAWKKAAELAASLNSLRAQFGADDGAGFDDIRARAEASVAALRAAQETLAARAPDLEKNVQLREENFALVRRILSFAEAREQLRDAEPCPLCGAPDHPFALGNIPAPDVARARLDAARGELRAVTDELAETKVQLVRQEAALERAERSFADSAAQSAALDALEAEHKNIAAARAELFGNRVVDAEERELAKNLRAAENAFEHSRRARDANTSALREAERRLLDLRAAIARRKESLAAAGNDFSAAAAAKGFSDESAYLAARLVEEERGVLRSRAERLAAELKELSTLEREIRSRLAAEAAKALTADPAETLAAWIAALRAESTQLALDIGAHAERLRANAASASLRAVRLALFETQRRECTRWEKLHLLIGSHDGAKYRNFAQGITFDLMLGHANRQLQRLSDRYILVRDSEPPLSLSVMDAYQGGGRRSIRNLSGGETFLVSLALALGLSTLSSRNISVDSLFLDEGFGSLDEETLESALETLSHLRNEGKLICAISHLPHLKERIPTQLVLTPSPVNAAVSVLSGPGCAAVRDEQRP